MSINKMLTFRFSLRFPGLWLSFTALCAWTLCFMRLCFRAVEKTGLAGYENVLFIVISAACVLGMLIPLPDIRLRERENMLLFRASSLLAVPFTVLAVNTAAASALLFTFFAALAAAFAMGICLYMLSATPRQGRWGMFFGTAFAVSEAVLVLLFFLPFLSVPAAAAVTALCAFLAAAAISMRPPGLRYEQVRDQDRPEPFFHPPSRRTLPKYLLALFLCCVMDGILDNLYAFDNSFYEFPNHLLYLYLYSITLNLLAGFLFDRLNWRKTLLACVLIVCAGQSLAFFSSISALAVPYLALSTMGVVVIEFFARVLPVLYAGEQNRAAVVSRLGYVSLYLGLCATSVLFEQMPRGRYFFVMGIVLVLAFLILALLHTGSVEEETQQRILLAKRLQEILDTAGTAENGISAEYLDENGFTSREIEVALLLIEGKEKGEIARSLHLNAAEREEILDSIRRKVTRKDDPDPIIIAVVKKYRLTGRQTDMLRHIRGGMTNAEIAKALSISEETVKVHIRNLKQKLSISHKQEIAEWLEDFGKSKTEML